jgi:uncharacterized repeat protein (TIGR01451 family)
MSKRMKVSVLRAALVALLVLVMVGVVAPTSHAHPKSLYLASDHHSSQFDAWEIKPDGTVDYQATYTLQYSTDPAGIAIDEDSGVIFITSEFSGGVEMVDPVTLDPIDVSSGPSNLAGIDVDDVDDIVYAVQRYTNQLYIFLWDEVNQTLTQDAVVSLPNCSGAFGLALDEFTDVLWVADGASGVVRAYDVDVASWSDISEVPALSFQPSHVPIDIAVDRIRGYAYTVSMRYGAWTPPGAGSNLLSKYDLATSTETTADLGCHGVGVTVDEVTGYAYVTVSPYCGGSYQGEIQSWDPSTTPLTQIDVDTVSGSPAGIATANVSYNPLKLAKNDLIVGEVYIGSTFTYEITYENPHPYDVHNVTIVDTLPSELDFVSASDGGVYDPNTHTVTWDVGDLPAETPPTTLELVVKVNQTATPDSTIYNYATVTGDEVPSTTVIDDEGSEDPDDEPGTPIGEWILVPADIKPQSCPNPLSTEDKGVVPVAIVGTEDFDAGQVDPASIRLEGVAPLRWAWEDVAEPFEPYVGKGDCFLDCWGWMGDEAYPGDGYMDLTLKFKAQEVIAALGDVEDGDCPVLHLTGNLMDEYGGVPIFGEDVVWILKKGK